MSCSLQWRWGDSTEDPSLDELRLALEELDTDDSEHPDTWLIHDSGWTLTADQSGLLVWDQDQDDPRHMLAVTRARVLELWTLLCAGQIAAIDAEPWRPGRNPRPSAGEREAIAKDHEAVLLAARREFYDALGQERSEVPCRRAGCARGAVSFSVHCRPHHFENIHGVPCPFAD